MQHCIRCKERWFDVELTANGTGICKKCLIKDRNKRDNKLFYYSATNKLNFGAVPEFLPSLKPLKELFIAKVYVSVNIFTIYFSAFSVFRILTLRYPGP